MGQLPLVVVPRIIIVSAMPHDAIYRSFTQALQIRPVRTCVRPKQAILELVSSAKLLYTPSTRPELRFDGLLGKKHHERGDIYATSQHDVDYYLKRTRRLAYDTESAQSIPFKRLLLPQPF